MNIKSLNRLISVFIIALLLLQPLAIAAASENYEVTPTPTESPAPQPEPTAESQATPTPTPDASSSEQTETAEQVITPTSESQTATGEAILNTGSNAAITTNQADSTTITVVNTNTATIEKNLELRSITGENSANNNVTPSGGTEVTTGDATVAHNSSTVVNTNIVGTNFVPVIVDFVNPQSTDLDFSTIAPCSDNVTAVIPEVLTAANTGNNVQILDSVTADTTVNIANTNNADIINTIDITAQTGNNQAVENIGDTSISTGNAAIDLNLFTMANTNLVGNCFFFGVINLFGAYTGDIILPYELGFISNQPQVGLTGQSSKFVNTGDNVNASTATQNNTSILVDNKDNATVNHDVTALSNTGENTIIDAINFQSNLALKTGNATTKINIMDLANTSIFANRFLLVRVNHFGNWQGNLIGPSGTMYGESDYFVFILSPFSQPAITPQNTDSSLFNTGDNVDLGISQNGNTNLTVHNDNTATVTNNINLLSNTGGNEAGKFNVSVKTGDASITANILNFLNTNIVGNNWFYAVINVFDNFVGNILFPRPDLAVGLSADRSTTTADSEFNYYIGFANRGQYKAVKTRLTQALPSEVEVLAVGGGGAVSGSTVQWDLGDISKNQTGQLSVRVRVKDLGFTQKNLVSTASIATLTDEPYKDNNSASTTVSYLKQPPPPASPQSSPSTGTNNSGSNSGGASTIQSVSSASTQSTKKVVKKKVKKVAKSKKKSKKITKKKALKKTIKNKNSKMKKMFKKVKRVFKKPTKKIKQSLNLLLKSIVARIRKIDLSISSVFSPQYIAEKAGTQL